MSFSLEALAMSGADFLEVGFDFEEWEKMESEIPPYLLAEEEGDTKGYDDCEGEKKYGKVEERESFSSRFALSFGIIIICTMLLVRKYRKTRSSLASSIPCNVVFAHILAQIIPSCL